MSTSHVSPNFTWAEFTSHDGAEVPLELQPNVRRLCANVLEPLRERFGGPLVVISGYRSPWHNKAVGGAEHSQHVLALAADVRPVRMEDLMRLRAVVEGMMIMNDLPALGGIGYYPGQWVHLDARDRHGAVARWFGKGVGSEVTG